MWFKSIRYIFALAGIFLLCSGLYAQNNVNGKYITKKHNFPAWHSYLPSYPVYLNPHKYAADTLPWNIATENPLQINQHLVHLSWGTIYMTKLMTYNIRGTLGIDNQRSLDRIAQVIKESGAQIICLQEVDQGMNRSGLIDQPAELAQKLGMNYAFQGNLQVGPGWYGIAILTSYEILQKQFHHLTSKDEPRGALEVTIQAPERPLTVFCTHLGLEEDERVTQTAELAEIVNAVDGPKLICGDFNEEAADPGVSQLISLAGLKDSDPNGTLTFDSKKPYCRIDMILSSSLVSVSPVSVLNTQASDHFPLLADICITGACN